MRLKQNKNNLVERCYNRSIPMARQKCFAYFEKFLVIPFRGFILILYIKLLEIASFMKKELLTTAYTNTLWTANNYNSDNREDLYTPEQEELRC